MNTQLRDSFNETQLDVPVAIPMATVLISPYVINPSLEQIIMKALFKNIPIFLLTVGLIFLVGCASTSKR